MKRVLLVSNKVFHYRIPIYNYFHEKFLENGIEFSLLANEVQKESPEKLAFEHHIVPFSFIEYQKIIKEWQPDVIITFLHLKNLILWPLLHYCKIKKIPIIKWGHGVNLVDQNNKFKKMLFGYIHNLVDAIIIYSEEEKRHFSPKSLKKCFIAYNTINFSAIPKVNTTIKEIKDKYDIPFEKVVLFVGRITKHKKVDILLDFFKDKKNQSEGLVIVGPDMSEAQLEIVKDSPCIRYLGPIYDHIEVNEIFKMADIFCIPGANGLGVNQAMYWGLPILTIDSGQHSPEITYVKNGRNGLLVSSEKELAEKLHFLLQNESKLKELSVNAANDIRQEANIDRMFNGFLEAVNYTTGYLEKKVVNNYNYF